MELLQWLITGGAMGALGLSIATYLKTRPVMKEAELKGEDALWAEIRALRARAEAMTAEAKADRLACEERVERIETRYLAEIEGLHAEIRVLRHDRNNLHAGFTAMLAMLKRPDANVPQVIAAVEEMVAKGSELVAIERAALARSGS